MESFSSEYTCTGFISKIRSWRVRGGARVLGKTFPAEACVSEERCPGNCWFHFSLWVCLLRLLISRPGRLFLFQPALPTLSAPWDQDIKLPNTLLSLRISNAQRRPLRSGPQFAFCHWFPLPVTSFRPPSLRLFPTSVSPCSLSYPSSLPPPVTPMVKNSQWFPTVCRINPDFPDWFERSFKIQLQDYLPNVTYWSSPSPRPIQIQIPSLPHPSKSVATFLVVCWHLAHK